VRCAWHLLLPLMLTAPSRPTRRRLMSAWADEGTEAVEDRAHTAVWLADESPHEPTGKFFRNRTRSPGDRKRCETMPPHLVSRSVIATRTTNVKRCQRGEILYTINNLQSGGSACVTVTHPLWKCNPSRHPNRRRLCAEDPWAMCRDPEGCTARSRQPAAQLFLAQSPDPVGSRAASARARHSQAGGHFAENGLLKGRGDARRGLRCHQAAHGEGPGTLTSFPATLTPCVLLFAARRAGPAALRPCWNNPQNRQNCHHRREAGGGFPRHTFPSMAPSGQRSTGRSNVEEKTTSLKFSGQWAK
jgi:hypothetical protein